MSSSHRQKSWAQESGMEVEVPHLTIALNILLRECLILNPLLEFCWFGGLHSKQGTQP